MATVSFVRQRRGGTGSTAQDPQEADEPSDAQVDDKKEQSPPYKRRRRPASTKKLAVVAVCATLLTTGSMFFGEAPQKFGEQWVYPWLLPAFESLGIDLLSKRPYQCVPLTFNERLKFFKGAHVPHLPIVTNSSAAQVLFDQGLLNAWGFNQLEALTSFQMALEQDPDCAMCYWGVAYARGPNVNRVAGVPNTAYPVYSQEDARAAGSAAAQALQRLGARPVPSDKADVAASNRQYIEAMVLRYSHADHHPDSFKDAELAYAHAMKELAAKYPADATAKALAGEALLNTSPWAYHETVGSEELRLNDLAKEVDGLLREALALDPSHALALHLHVHLWEAARPGACPGCSSEGMVSAEKLQQLALPQGHLRHMPAHIYVTNGRFIDAVDTNTAAYWTDVRHGQRCVVAYLPEHNLNMLVYAAATAGMFKTAEKYAKLMRDVPLDMPASYVAKGREWVTLPLLYARHGLWDRLKRPGKLPEGARGVTSYGGYEFARMVHAYVQLLALCSSAQTTRGELMVAPQAEPKAAVLRDRAVSLVQWAAGNLTRLEQLAKQVPEEPQTEPGEGPGLYASGYKTLAGILLRVAQAAVHLLRPDHAKAITLLQEAVALQDGLGYYEPARLHQPLRQCLGWVQLAAGRPKDAKTTYTEDLDRTPLNGWSLYGMFQAESQLANMPSADRYFVMYEEAFKKADVKLTSSCPQLSNLPFLRNVGGQT